jgi:hypothetical protein
MRINEMLLSTLETTNFPEGDQLKHDSLLFGKTQDVMHRHKDSAMHAVPMQRRLIATMTSSLSLATVLIGGIERPLRSLSPVAGFSLGLRYWTGKPTLAMAKTH